MTITGFYYKVGSRDYPYNYDPNKPYGFNEKYPAGSELSTISAITPVFSYSINDVEKAFTKCTTITRRSLVNLDDNTAGVMGDEYGVINLLFETENVPELAGAYTGPETLWTDVFKVIEVLAENQSSVTGLSSSNEYSTYGDELLKADEVSNKPNPYKVDSYIKGSFNFKHGKAGRLFYVTFSIENKSNSYVEINGKNYETALEGGATTNFTIYIDPDYFIEQAIAKYEVYHYLDDDNMVTHQEMKDLIVKKIFNSAKDAKYRSVKEFFVNKHLSSTEIIKDQFFIFSSLREKDLNNVNDEEFKKLIRKYLENMIIAHPELGIKLEDLKKWYPDLYTTKNLYLIPMYGNFITTTGNSSELKYPVAISDIESVLTSQNITISKKSPQNYRHVELFYVGPGAGWAITNGSDYAHKFPILCYDEDPNSQTIHPLSSRLPNYIPIYGGQGTNSGGLDTLHAEFHNIMVSILSYIRGKTSSPPSTLDKTFEEHYSVVDNENSNYITFEFIGEKWNIRKPSNK